MVRVWQIKPLDEKNDLELDASEAIVAWDGGNAIVISSKVITKAPQGGWVRTVTVQKLPPKGQLGPTQSIIGFVGGRVAVLTKTRIRPKNEPVDSDRDVDDLPTLG